MSWSFAVTNVPSAPEQSLRAALEDAWLAVPKDPQSPNEEIDEQVAAAIDAAVGLAKTVHGLESCCDQPGEACCTVNVTLGGHARAGHAPDGTAPEQVTVSVGNATGS